MQGAAKEAIKVLAMKSCHSDEVREKLAKKGYNPQEIEEAIESLKPYFDDETLLKNYVLKELRKGNGCYVILGKLRNKGFRQESLDFALSFAGEHQELAKESLRRKFPALDEAQFARKCYQRGLHL